MFDRKVVFILGAGASVPYKFPDGRGLLRSITESLKNNNSVYLPQFTETEMLAFKGQLSLSGTSSIDEFLTNNREHDSIGRYSIVKALMDVENSHFLMNAGDEAWYHYLFEALRTGIRSVDLSQVSFITFNYDRSLEQYLWLRLTFDFGLSEPEAVDVLKDLNIVHIHGQMGRLPWQDTKMSNVMNPYEKSEDEAHIKRVASCLRIQHEAHEQTTQAGENACSLIQSAQVIFFLGLGYSDENMGKLGFKASQNISTQNQVFLGTCLGWTDAEKERFQRRYSEITLGNNGDGTIAYLRDSQMFASIRR